MRPALALLLTALLTLAPPTSDQARAELPWTAIGFSQGGLPLVVHHVGSGARRVLILGGQHGGPEANTIALATALRDYFAEQPAEIPPELGLDVLTVAN